MESKQKRFIQTIVANYQSCPLPSRQKKKEKRRKMKMKRGV